MCFSAGASFGASAVVAVAGVISIKRVKVKTQITFASIPIIFSIQQLTEGLVWLTFTDEAYRYLQSIPVTIFLFLAQVLWPVWVPLAILFIEQNSVRRRALRILAGISLVLAPFQAYRLFFYPFDAEITPHHIHYSLDFSIPYYGFMLNIFYFMVTIFPPFLSTQKHVVTLGFLNLVSFLITAVFFKDNIISVWCFFAALISWQVVLAMKELNNKPQLESMSIK